MAAQRIDCGRIATRHRHQSFPPQELIKASGLRRFPEEEFLMRTIDRDIRRYLEIERLLNAFFATFDYCLPRCITPEIQNSGHKPTAACCTKKYYALYDLDHPAFELLRRERELLFGKPEQYHWNDPVSPCPYHNPAKGCVLATHKSPVCLSFLCRSAIDVLRNTFGIYSYDYLGVHYALEWILTGEFSEHQYNEFRNSILDMTLKVERSAVSS